MKGLRFYRDIGSEDGGKRAFRTACRERGVKPAHDTTLGNVVAVALDDQGRVSWYPRLSWTLGDVQYQAEAYVAVLASANSPVCGGSVSREYLSECCIRVPERVARAIHPALFVRIESDMALVRDQEAQA